MNPPNIIESLVNAKPTPYLFGFIGWLLMWKLQLQLDFLDYALGVSLAFLPAGIRTLAVLIFGLRGAIGVFAGSVLSTIEYLGHIQGMDFFEIALISAISAFSAYLMMQLVCWWRKIGSDLDELTFSDLLVVVFSQGLLSSTLHQMIYSLRPIEASYDHPSTAEALRLWSAMAAGDIVGSMILMLSAVALVNLGHQVRRIYP